MVRRRATFAAAKLGLLPLFRRGDPATIKDVAEGLDYYWEVFHQPDLYIQHIAKCQMVDRDTDEEIMTKFYHVE